MTWLSQTPVVPSGCSPGRVSFGGNLIFSALATFTCCGRWPFPFPALRFCLFDVLFACQAVIFSSACVKASFYAVSSWLAKQCPVLISFPVSSITQDQNLGFYLPVQMYIKTPRKTHHPRNLGSAHVSWQVRQGPPGEAGWCFQLS